MRSYVAPLAILLLTASLAWSGIVFVPVTELYEDLEFAETRVRTTGNGVRVRTSDLSVDATVHCGEVAMHLTEKESIDFVFSTSRGEVNGQSTTVFSLNNQPVLIANSRIRGTGACVEFDGRECGRLSLVLASEGPLTRPGDDSAAGVLRKEMVGGLVLGGQRAAWTALSSNAELGGNEALLQQVCGQ